MIASSLSDRRMRHYLLGIALLTSIYCYRQAMADTSEDGRVWLTYTAEHLLNPEWKVNLQLQPYWRDEGRTYDQVTYRHGLYYLPNTRWMLGGGYAYALGHPQSNKNTHENRLWEDIVYQLEANNDWRMSLRTRLEHRHFEEGDGQMLHGLRETIKVSIPTRYSVSVVIWDECYFNINETANGVRGFDQNRLFLGIATKVTDDSALELGYVNQFSHRSAADIENHILGLSLSQSF